MAVDLSAFRNGGGGAEGRSVDPLALAILVLQSVGARDGEGDVVALRGHAAKIVDKALGEK